MSNDEVEALTLVGELSDAELEAIVAGKGSYSGTPYHPVGWMGLVASRASNLGAGAFAGFRGFGSSLGSIGRGFALAAKR